MEPFGEADGVGDGLRKIAEEFRHGGGVFEMTFAVLGEEFAGGVQVSVMADAGKDIEHLTSARFGVKDAVGGEEWEMELLRQVGAGAQPTIFAAKEMALNFDEDILWAENAH